MLLSRDLDALQKQHDAYIAAAEKAAASQQGRRKRVGKWIPLQTIKSNLQMAAAYKKVINQIREESA